MRRIQAFDRLLLLVLLPVWLVVFALHVKEIRRTGSAQVPVFASPSWDGDRYPTVGGFRLERESSGTGLQVGDRLLRIGDTDLTGVGYFGFDAIAFDVAGSGLEAPLAFERAGEPQQITLTLRPSTAPWARIPLSLSFVAIAVIVLLRAPGSAATRFFFAAFTTFAIFETPFEGGPPLQTYLAYAVFYLVGPLAVTLVIRWMILFPDEVPEARRLPRGLAWAGLLFLLARLNYVFGGPIPTALVPDAVLLSDAVFFATALFILTWNTVHADPLGRRRVKWVLFGAFVAGVPVLLNVAIEALFGLQLARFDQLLNANYFLALAMPLGILIAILRYRLFDIDRIISTTASYSVLAAGVFVGATTVIPPIARGLSAALGLEAESSQLSLSALMAAAAIPVHQWLRPQIDRVFFAERFNAERGTADLLLTLSDCADPRAATEQVGAGLQRLMRPELCAIYALVEEAYAVVFSEGREVPPSFEADGTLVGVLRQRRAALATTDGRRASGERLDPFERAALETLKAEVVVPVKQRDTLVAFICLGRKRSGDFYTPTDLSLLTATAEKLSHELLRFDQEEVIREGRAMQASLRRYVPGAIADELASGSELTSGEREVSVLFVDIRGYTKFSEGRGAEEIFSTVNRYTETVSTIVRQHDGSVVEFNGDGMMAIFGAPRELAHKEQAAVRAGRDIVRSVGEIRPDSGDRPAEPLSVGVGVATGPAFVGNIRAADRMIWSAIGNTTNLAARLQNLTRDLGASIIIDSATRDAAGPSASDFDERRDTTIRGRTNDVDVWALPLDTST
jgi:class 3 adenylate cyclase